ncbi:TfuA-like protein [Caballeronia sordidicola]|uniref:TfuA-like core domain-containing protein n=1 Tax=Caballeronia sordidicola TaxID=196367 RepID=A0A242MC14_CABSO|nr:TfuA-like protein [Caballeronia sordidicola]OTP68679.1 hypothetical protein PAMC26510_28905 [Caballeronia sordidicola]
MAEQIVHLYAGPSLGSYAIPKLSGAELVLHAPARRGDISSLVDTCAPACIAIADGVFHVQPAVGHAEIRDAVRAGWRIWGLCSIGAIRAIEMAHLGVSGFGEVFSEFVRNSMFRDDEVALLHLDEHPFTALSEPLIHIRRHTNELLRLKLIFDADAKILISALENVWFGARTVELYGQLLANICKYNTPLDQLDRELDPHRIKNQDLRKFLLTSPWIKTRASPVVGKSERKKEFNFLIEEFGGLPFIDEEFKCNTFMSAVAGVRKALLRHEKIESLEDVIRPHVINEIIEKRKINFNRPPENRSLTSVESALVNDVVTSILERHPSWEGLFSIPIEYRRWLSPQLSMTNPFIPQVIFLGEAAFCQSWGRLREIIIHECAHVWLAMLTEIKDFQTKDSPTSFILPSGTGNKDPRGILLAAHFATAVLSYIRGEQALGRLAGRLRERQGYLLWYLKNTLELPIGPYLSPTGTEVFIRLQRFVSEQGEAV